MTADEWRSLDQEAERLANQVRADQRQQWWLARNLRARREGWLPVDEAIARAEPEPTAHIFPDHKALAKLAKLEDDNDD
jgi:hypothetical protein